MVEKKDDQEPEKIDYAVRPVPINPMPPVALPSRRTAVAGLAAAGVVSPFAIHPGGGQIGTQLLGNGTPEAIRNRTAGSTPATFLSIPTGQWISYTVDRPTLLVCANADDNPNTSGAIMAFWYNYGQIPVVPQGNFGQPALSPQWSHAGVAFLGAVGTWYLRANSGLGNKDIIVYVIDSFELGTAFKWLGRPGANIVLQHNVTVPAVVTAVVGVGIVGAHPGRIGWRIENVNPSFAGAGQNVRISFDQPASYLTTGAAWTNQGYRLAVGEHIELQGDLLSRGQINAIVENGAGNPAALEVVEYFDWF